MTVYLLVFIFFTKGDPVALSGIFPDRFTCEQAEGSTATGLEKSKDVLGWTVPAACMPVEETHKI